MNALINSPGAYDRVTDIAKFVREFGDDIALSQIFGCETKEQGRVIAMECISRRLPPLQLAENYDIIHGRLAMKAQAMLAEFRERGGDHQKVEKSSDRVAIEFTTKSGEVFLEELTWEELSQEPTPYAGKEKDIVKQLQAGKKPELKSKYATPRSRANMMWNRLISDAIRTHAPEIVCGKYTPEEIEDFSGVEVANRELNQAGDANQSNESDAGEVVEAEYVVTTEFEESQAEPDSKFQVGIGDPCGPEMVKQIKDAIKTAAQTGAPEILKQVKDKLTSTGIGKLENLNVREAEVLLGAIQSKTMEKFFELDLARHGEGKNDQEPSKEPAKQEK